MISSIRRDGSTAAMTVEGATTSEVFRAYVEHILVPTLRPGDIVVLDNLSSHKDNKRSNYRTSRGRSPTPAGYSPDLNRLRKLEQVKALLRSAKARTDEALLLAIARRSPALPLRTPRVGLPHVATLLLKML